MGDDFVFTADTGGAGQSAAAIQNAPVSGINNGAEALSAPAPPTGAERTFGAGLAKRAAGSLTHMALAPLNQATGGLATPEFNVGKAAVAGTGAAAIGGAAAMLAIQAVQLAIKAIQEQIAKNKAKAAEMNERDNALIRAGAKSYATSYEGRFSGVKATDRR